MPSKKHLPKIKARVEGMRKKIEKPQMPRISRMSKAFQSGKLTGEVVNRTKNLSPNQLIILPQGEARSLVISDIDLEELSASLGAFYEVKPIAIEIGDTVTVSYEPRMLYPLDFNWLIQARHIKSIEVGEPELKAISTPKRKSKSKPKLNPKLLDEVWRLARRQKAWMLRHFRRDRPLTDLQKRLIATERDRPLSEYIKSYDNTRQFVKRLSRQQHALILNHIKNGLVKKEQ